MNAEYVVFPDQREDDGNYDEAVEATTGGLSGDTSDEVLGRLRCIDWRHPALVVYREDGDNRWSYLTVGLWKPEGLGESE